jgi:hypothetical protein
MSNLSYHQLYSRDSYHTRYEPEKGFYPGGDRNFHHSGCFYDTMAILDKI